MTKIFPILACFSLGLSAAADMSSRAGLNFSHHSGRDRERLHRRSDYLARLPDLPRRVESNLRRRRNMGFLTKLTPQGGRSYGTYIGGTGSETATAIALDG